MQIRKYNLYFLYARIGLFFFLIVMGHPCLAVPAIDSHGIASHQGTLAESGNRYTIQVCSFKELERANKVVNALNGHGLYAVASHEDVESKGMWYRVYVGLFDKVSEAKKTARELMEQGLISNYWIKDIKKLEIRLALLGDTPVGPVSDPSNNDVLMADNTESTDTMGEVHNQAQQDGRETGSFSLGLRIEATLSTDADDFRIAKNSGGKRYLWLFDEDCTIAHIVPSFKVNENLFIQGSIGKAFDTELDLWYLTAGPKLRLGSYKNIIPHIRGSLVWGHLDWDGVPGTFDDDFGWETGIGVEYNRLPYQFGLEVSYRDMEFDFSPQPGEDVASSDRSVDFSGFSLNGYLSLVF